MVPHTTLTALQMSLMTTQIHFMTSQTTTHSTENPTHCLTNFFQRTIFLLGGKSHSTNEVSTRQITLFLAPMKKYYFSASNISWIENDGSAGANRKFQQVAVGD
jgi:hypothetical protein